MNYAFVGGLSISQITFIAPVVTNFNRAFGLKPTLLTGAVLEAAALIFSSFNNRIWQLYLAQEYCLVGDVDFNTLAARAWYPNGLLVGERSQILLHHLGVALED